MENNAFDSFYDITRERELFNLNNQEMKVARKKPGEYVLNAGVNALTGVGSGASAGMMIGGPPGAAAGAIIAGIVGLGKGLFENFMSSKAEDEIVNAANEYNKGLNFARESQLKSLSRANEIRQAEVLQKIRNKNLLDSFDEIPNDYAQ